MSGDDLSRLSRAIGEHFRRGLRIDAHTALQIDSTLGPLSPRELKRRLADAADSENSTLVCLLFSPDRAVQVRLEPMLGCAARSAQEIAALRDELLGRGLRTSLHFADRHAAVDVPVPGEGIQVFLAGLHLDRSLPAPVCRAIDRHLPQDTRPAARVALRNAGIPDHRPVVDFLCRLLGRASMLQPDLQDCLTLAAALAAEADARTDLFESLEKLKAAHARRLRQARDSQDALRRGNAESLMLSGSRIFQIDPHETLRQMACIDAVALAAFGRRPTGIAQTRPLEIGGDGDADTVRRIGDLFR